VFTFKPDYQKTRDRIEAFWEFDVLDRPVVMFHLPKPASECVSYPKSNHPDVTSRWMDSTYQAEMALASLSNQDFLGDTLPIAYPNLGPEVFSAFYGCPLHFGDYGTSWSDPILHDWEKADDLQLDWNSPYLARLIEMTDALLEIGKDKFIVGMPDWHPGADCIAAFRDPQNLAMDMITNKADVMRMLERITIDYFRIYDLFYTKLRSAGMPITSWTPLVSEGKYYIPSNDFSIMVSKQMYDEVFLPGITAECRFLNHSIYHLDGPGALRHLDSILAIPELNALQWVYGAGNEGIQKWMHVYKKAQSLRKGIQVTCRIDEINLVMETLSPRGMFLSVDGVSDRDTAQNLLKALEQWTAQKTSNGVL
jgi:hypothetical protein